MGGNKYLDKAIQVANQAVSADNEGNYEGALQLYRKALEYFDHCRKYEKNKKVKEKLEKEMINYIQRAETIKKHLSENKQKKELASSNGAPIKNKKKKKNGNNNGNNNDEKNRDGDDDDEEDDPETAKLVASLSNAIVSEKPNVKWDDIAGLREVKKLLKEAVVLPVQFPELFTDVKPWCGILLYGPPGTGKSYLAKAVATEAGSSTFFSLSSSDLVSKYLGESERLVRNLFELARKKAPCIIFIDEIDSLCGSRSEGENDSARRIKTEFLVQMQGVGKGNKGILVLGATNTPWELDKAIKRRFEKRVLITLPDAQARAEMFRIFGNKASSVHVADKDYEYLAEQTEGFSGSDISQVVKGALYEPIRTCQDATHFTKFVKDGKVFYKPCAPNASNAIKMGLYDIPKTAKLEPPACTLEDFERALSRSKKTVATSDLVKFDEWTKEFGSSGN